MKASLKHNHAPTILSWPRGQSGIWLRLKFMKQPPQRGSWMHHRPISYFHQQTLLLWVLVLVDQPDSNHLQEVCLSQGNQNGKGSWLVNHFKEGSGRLFP